LISWDALLTTAHAWQLRPSELGAPPVRDRWLRHLSDDERAHYRRLQTDAAGENFLAARMLCRAALSKYTGLDPSEWRFGRSLNGKPTLVEPIRFKSLRFNLTHTNGLVVCIVTRAGEAGVDAEDTSQPVDALLVARHFLEHRTEEELTGLPARERAARMLEQWVLKEAYVKATGRGLVDTPERLTVQRGSDGRPMALGRCQFSVCRPTSTHVAAAAVLARYKAVLISFEWLDGTELF
jgi:4'-phosphopantetheinyl transferase